MKIYLFLSLFISSFRSQKVSGSESRHYNRDYQDLWRRPAHPVLS